MEVSKFGGPAMEGASISQIPGSGGATSGQAARFGEATASEQAVFGNANAQAAAAASGITLDQGEGGSGGKVVVEVKLDAGLTATIESMGDVIGTLSYASSSSTPSSLS